MVLRNEGFNAIRKSFVNLHQSTLVFARAEINSACVQPGLNYPAWARHPRFGYNFPLARVGRVVIGRPGSDQPAQVAVPRPRSVPPNPGWTPSGQASMPFLTCSGLGSEGWAHPRLGAMLSVGRLVRYSETLVRTTLWRATPPNSAPSCTGDRTNAAPVDFPPVSSSLTRAQDAPMNRTLKGSIVIMFCALSSPVETNSMIKTFVD